jgi:hypothetical protein
MSWQTRGLIYQPRGLGGVGGSHAQVPTVLLREDRLRIYYADRDTCGKSFTTYIDVCRKDPTRVLYEHHQAILPRGEPGTFDDDGMMPSCCIRNSGKLWLYYTGWNRGITVPYRNSVGIAVSSDDGDSFSRLFKGPVLDRSPMEPHIAVTPSIIVEDGLWRMWYSSGHRWVEVNGRQEPIYHIKYADSLDGISWRRPNHLCIAPRHDLEAYSHPTVVKRGGTYHMWFCSRHSVNFRNGAGSYRIGYATSRDGLQWSRDDGAHGVPPANSGWDALMTCYPFVLEFDDGIHLFYNGNGFGRSGIGYARLEP